MVVHLFGADRQGASCVRCLRAAWVFSIFEDCKPAAKVLKILAIRMVKALAENCLGQCHQCHRFYALVIVELCHWPLTIPDRTRGVSILLVKFGNSRLRRKSAVLVNKLQILYRWTLHLLLSTTVYLRLDFGGAMAHRGFTLIELMIVVAIIAVIAAIAIPALMRSRMVANQAAAIACCKAYADAQEIYKRTDYDKDGVFEYAQSLQGNNSLLETTLGAGDLELIDASFGHAEGNPGAVPPKDGYVFRVQKKYFNGIGNKSFLIGTNMTLGYGLCAVPAAYDSTGRDTIIISNLGVIYQDDRGPSTKLTGTFNPTGYAMCE